MTWIRALALVAALALPGAALADPGKPHNIGSEGSYTRVGAADDKVPNHAVLTTIGYVNTSTGTAALKDRLFMPWGSILHVEGCGEPTTFCFVQSTNELAVDQHGFITDTGTDPDGGGGRLDAMCHGFSVGSGARDIFLNKRDFYDTDVAVRDGYCYSATTALLPYNGWPCDETVDCPGASVCHNVLHDTDRPSFSAKFPDQRRGAFVILVDADGVVTSNTCQIDTEK